MPGVGQFTPGAIWHFVVIPAVSTTQAYFLGTCVTAPKPRNEQYEIPVMNDIGGRSVRFQSINDGEEWKVFTTLNRFDLNVARTLRYLKSGAITGGGGIAVPTTGPLLSNNHVFGSQNGTSRGTLVLGVQDFQLILVNGYAASFQNNAGVSAGQPITAAVDLQTLRGWYSCSLTAYEEDTEQNRVLEVAMAIECRNLYNPTTRTFANYFEGATFNGITITPSNLS